MTEERVWSRNPEPVKARYHERETGWVVPLGEYLCRVQNIPFDGPYNLGDIVALGPKGEDGLPCLGRIVYREFPCRTAFFVADEGEYRALKAFIDQGGTAISRQFAAGTVFKKELVMAAHHGEVDVIGKARELGIEAMPAVLAEVEG